MTETQLSEHATPVVRDLYESGFVVVPDVLDGSEIEALRRAISERIEAEAGIRAHGIRNLRSRVPLIAELARSDPITGLVSEALGQPGMLVRSILFDKVPGANWKVTWHQDLTVAVQRRIDVPGFGPWTVKDGVVSAQAPPAVLESMVTIRIHLDDCGRDNGPLRVIPGTHRLGILAAAVIADLVASRESVSCLVAEGGALLMRPLLLHASSDASSPDHRRVVHLDFAPQELPGGLAWSRVA